MPLSPEAQNYYNDPTIRDILVNAWNESQIQYTARADFWGERASIRREGSYPLVTNEGAFWAELHRTLPLDLSKKQGMQGGEFRTLMNEQLTSDDLDGKPLHVVVDTIPMFLKELSDSKVQAKLSVAREKLANTNEPGALIQTRTSDIHDGELRQRHDGQLDIYEEIWYGKILQIMRMYPGLTQQDASKILASLGEKPYIADFGLGFATLIDQKYGGKIPENITVDVLDGTDLLTPFQGDHGEAVALLSADASATAKIKERLQLAFAPEAKEYSMTEGEFRVETLARYPIMQNGVEFQATLLSVYQKGKLAPQTFRILEYGDRALAYLRIDSICTNGVQGGDSHCDCRKQSEAEKARAFQGIPMILINIRDDEGRFHGEGRKGGTLAAQRAINDYILGQIAAGTAPEWMVEIGNGIGAELFYFDSGEPVDAREYGASKAVLQYLGIKDIAHLVTNNEAKIAVIGSVCSIHETVTAQVFEGISKEAQRTYADKKNGTLGVNYQY